MYTSTSIIKRFAKALLCPAAFTLVLAACEAPKSSADYRDDFPLTVGVETVTLPLVIPFSSKEFPAQEGDRLKSFVNDFINRGNGRITIETGSERDGGSLVSSRIHQVQKALTNAGVSYREITFKTNSPLITGYGNVTLSFLANTVDVPECGDWSTSASYNWTNRRHYNYGCAIQRNIGLMVADPGDLKRPKPVSGKSAYRVNGVITHHRTGTATGAANSLP